MPFQVMIKLTGKLRAQMNETKDDLGKEMRDMKNDMNKNNDKLKAEL